MSETPAEQALRARRSVGCGGGYGLLRVTGADRIPFLHRVLTCDVKGIPIGGARRGLLLTPKGKVVADTLLAVLPDRVELLAPPAASRALVDGLGKYAISDEVTLEDRTGLSGFVLLLGPRAMDAAARFVGGTLPHAEVAEVVVNGVPFVVIRDGYAGLPATWIRFDLPVDVGVLQERNVEIARFAKEVGGGTLDASALDVLRIEAGQPSLGAEATEDTLPQECGMEDRVSFTKGCFVGQEPVARLKTRGHTNRGLAGLLFEPGTPLPSRGDALLAGEKECGSVTSAVESPTLGRPIALALLRHEHAAPGTRLTVRSAGGGIPAEVAELPFVR